MYIIVIGWLYVVILMAILETSWVVSLVTIVLYGLLPLFILMYVNRAAIRRRKKVSKLPDEQMSKTDRQNAKSDEGDLLH